MSYFTPLRRKLGVVTLLMTCAIAAGWLRTYRIEEQIILTHGGPSHVFTSRDGCLRWTSYYQMRLPDYSLERYPAGAKFGVSEPLDRVDLQWQWRWQRFGFDFGKGFLHTRSSVGVSVVPYWSLVMPLALISAYLLLSKPRPPKSGPTHVENSTESSVI